MLYVSLCGQPVVVLGIAAYQGFCYDVVIMYSICIVRNWSFEQNLLNSKGGRFCNREWMELFFLARRRDSEWWSPLFDIHIDYKDI